MGGGGTTTTSSSSGLNSPALNNAVDLIGRQLSGSLDQGSKVFDQSMYPGLSSQTQAGVSSLTNNPNNSVFSQGISDTLRGQADIAAGNVQNDALRQRALDDALTASNSVFTASGRFGSGSHATNLAEGATNALAGLDYQRQQQAIQNLPGLYQASMLPASAQLQAGQIMDADALSQRQGEADLYDRLNNRTWNDLARGTSILAGTAPSAGTTNTQTQSQQTPWWQTPLQIGGSIFGALF